MPRPPVNIRLHYRFDAARAEDLATRSQDGAQVENPLFDLLGSLQAQGSIKAAAAALGLSYRHVWGQMKEWESVLGQDLLSWSQGRRAVLTPFAQRLMWAERQARTRLTPHLEALRTELRRALQEAEDERHQVVNLQASHDLVLAPLQRLGEASMLHLNVHFSSSTEALRALNAGQCELAGFHVPRLPSGSSVFAEALQPLLVPGQHKLIGSHARRQGLMVRAAMAQAAPKSMAQVIQQGLRMAARQPGSSTRLLAEHLVASEIDAAHAGQLKVSVVENTHVAVAAAVASGAADVALGIEEAARMHGLAFVPIVDEDYFLVCLKDQLTSPGVDLVRQVLGSSAWLESLGAMPPGAHRPGAVLSLTQALPWWHFARPRRKRARQGPA